MFMMSIPVKLPSHSISAKWQKILPTLLVVGFAMYITLFREDPFNDRAIFAALLVISFAHQIEEHLFPGGFRQFVNAHVFRSGRDDRPASMTGVAQVNIGYVWVPLALAVSFPETLRWVGLAWIGLTLIDGIIHVVTTVVLGRYNPGFVTGLLLLIPFTKFVLVHEVTRGTLSEIDVGWIIMLGILLYVPIAVLFVAPLQRSRRIKAQVL